MRWRKEEGGRRKGRASVGRALRNAGEQAIKTEICLSAASLFPFSRIAGDSARSDAALIFLFANFIFSSRKRKSGPQPWEKGKKVAPPNFGKERGKYYSSIRENETLNLNSTTPVAPLRHFARCISPTRLGADANNLSGRCTNSTISAAAS